MIINNIDCYQSLKDIRTDKIYNLLSNEKLAYNKIKPRFKLYYIYK